MFWEKGAVGRLREQGAWSRCQKGAAGDDTRTGPGSSPWAGAETARPSGREVRPAGREGGGASDRSGAGAGFRVSVNGSGFHVSF